MSYVEVYSLTVRNCCLLLPKIWECLWFYWIRYEGKQNHDARFTSGLSDCAWHVAILISQVKSNSLCLFQEYLVVYVVHRILNLPNRKFIRAALTKSNIFGTTLKRMLYLIYPLWSGSALFSIIVQWIRTLANSSSIWQTLATRPEERGRR